MNIKKVFTIRRDQKFAPNRQAISKTIEKVTLTFLVLVILFDGFRSAQLSRSQIHLGLNLSGAECFISVLGFSILFGAAIMYWLRNGASLYR